MNAVLLDTVVVLRALFLPEKLTPRAETTLKDPGIGLHFSPASLWEIGIKMSLSGFDGIRLPEDWDKRIPAALSDLQAGSLTIRAEDCRRVQDLPFHHRDPFDRMLIAQSLERGLDIISPDPGFDAYGVRRIW